MAAAADLADEIGFEHLTLAALAKQFGVRDASLYAHVRGLDDLRGQVALLALDEWADRLGSAVAGRSGKAALIEFADTYRRFAVTHAGRYAATRIPLAPELVEQSAGAPRILELCYALLRGYELSEPEATDAIRLLRSAIHGFIDLEVTGQFTADRDIETSWHRAIDALHRTLTDWSQPNRQGATR